MSKKQPRYNWYQLIITPAWVVVSFFAAQLLVAGIMLLAGFLGVPFKSLDQTVLNTVVTLLVYVVTLIIAITLPYLFKKITTSWSELGLTRAIQWKDIGYAPVGFIVYFISAGILMYIVSLVFPGIDLQQEQATGFKSLHTNWEYILAFASLVIVAPIAEEVVFRGYLMGKLQKYLPFWVVVVATSIVFAGLHLPGDGAQLQWNVAFNVFALSVVLCLLRPLTGSIWAGVLLHMIKNGVAFYLLFINPLLM